MGAAWRDLGWKVGAQSSDGGVGVGGRGAQRPWCSGGLGPGHPLTGGWRARRGGVWEPHSGAPATWQVLDLSLMTVHLQFLFFY